MITTHSFPFRRRALVLALMLASSAAHAATINVRGDCKLIAAINNANSDTDTDGAGFGCNTGSGADNLSLTTNGLYSLTEVVQGDEDGLPWITSTITINGHGATIARTGGSNFRLIHVAATGNLTLNSLTLTGGALYSGANRSCLYSPYICPGGGGGILNYGKAVLNNTSISGNRAYSNDGIANNGDMILNNSRVSGNSGYYSNGGILNTGNMTLNHSTVSNNDSGWKIGGILNTGNMTLNHSTVSNNDGASEVGGILNTGNMALNQSSVSGNNDMFKAGGIFNTGTMTLSHSIVARNGSSYFFCSAYSCHDGYGSGGIENRGKMTLNYSSVSDNTGGYLDSDSGMGVSNSGSLTLNKSTISGNQGGGIRNFSNMILNKTTVSGNKKGGIGSSGNLTFSHSTISSNDGRGFQNNISGTALLTNSSIVGNKANPSTGISNQGSMKLTNITISNNSGGAIVNRGKLMLNHGTLSGNAAVSIRNYSGAEITLSNSIIANSELLDCGNTGILTQKGNNLIEDGSCGAPLKGDPKLAPLFDNGGYTPTHALLDDSPALNAADKNYCVATDQRNVLRPLLTSGECDLGAFERRDDIPISIAPVMQFFDQQAEIGAITGLGAKAAGNRLDAVRNQLFVAGHYKNRNKTSAACLQLARTVKRIDPDNSPDDNDLVTGSTAGQLADQLLALRAEWLCK